MRIITFFFALLIICGSASGQGQGGILCSKHKAEAFVRQARNARVAYPGDTKIDVKYHHLNLNISYTAKYISGAVRTDFVTTEDNFTACSFDLNAALKVDSVIMNKSKVNFARSGNKINLTFAQTYSKAQKLSLTIYYQGTPQGSAFGSFSFGTHGGGSPAVWSLSEPYGAPDWWPCKDDPSDKIDSVAVSVTMPSAFVSVSNGVLKEQKTNADNTKTYHWESRYPISHYLISVACSNYAEYTDYFKYSATDSMKISHFIYPEVLTTNLKKQLDETADMLQYFSDQFGLYPFIKEKYGHAMCGFGGGMEHQTVSSMGGFNQDLISHELAHQWFGDKITCKTWADIWVNEGFASYSEALYAEHKSGKPVYDAYMQEYIRVAKNASGTLSIKDIQDENKIFDYNLVYGKGAVVLHMLRGVLGDKVFFEVLKGYANSEFAYGAAGIDDFRTVAERISKKDLKYFFDQWLYGESYPRYQYSWSKTGNNSVAVTINQNKLTTAPNYFSMPVELKLSLSNQKDTTVIAFVESNTKVFQFTNLAAEVKSIVFDPGNKIMKTVSENGVISGLEDEGTLFVIYPNPTEKSLKIRHSLTKIDKMEVLDISGRAVISEAYTSDELNVSSLYPGKYFLRISYADKAVSKAFVVK